MTRFSLLEVSLGHLRCHCMTLHNLVFFPERAGAKSRLQLPSFSLPMEWTVLFDCSLGGTSLIVA